MAKEGSITKEKETLKIPKKRLMKEKVVELLRLEAVLMKLVSKQTKNVRGHYHNWFASSLWLLIFYCC